jgi:hypothetical protein
MTLARALAFSITMFTALAVRAAEAQETKPALPPGTGGAETPKATGGGSEKCEDAPLDEKVRARLAAVNNFVQRHDRDAEWKTKENDDQSCVVHPDERYVDLTFRADGVMHCKLNELAEGYKVRIWILAIATDARKPAKEKAGNYLITATPGTALSGRVAVRGAFDDAKAAADALAKLGLHGAEAEVPADWSEEGDYGPFHNSSVTLKIELKAAAIAAETKVTIAPLYTFNIGVFAIGNKGDNVTYSVADMKIQEQKSTFKLGYFVGVQWYPFSWNKDGRGHWTSGRYFNDLYTNWYDRVGLAAAISLTEPTKTFYVGLSVSVVAGFNVTAGWWPGVNQKLKTGYMVGQPIEGTEPPVDDKWDWSRWGVGLAVDATVAKTLTSAFGK